jgi:hypothetical protein
MRAKLVNESIKHLKPRSEEELQTYYDSLDEVAQKVINLRKILSTSIKDKDILGPAVWDNLSIKDRQELIDKWCTTWQWNVGSSNAKKRFKNINNYDLNKWIIGLGYEENDEDLEI